MRLCPQCAEPVIQPAIGRPRRFCCDDCRRSWNRETAAIRNTAAWQRIYADEAEQTAERLAAQRYSADTVADWIRRAAERRAEADELEELARCRVAGIPVT